MIDVNHVRDPDIALHGLIRADERYTIYYDETNNIRRCTFEQTVSTLANPNVSSSPVSPSAARFAI